MARILSYVGDERFGPNTVEVETFLNRLSRLAPGEYGPLTSSTWERSCPAKTHTKNGKAPSRDNAINEARNFETIELWIRL